MSKPTAKTINELIKNLILMFISILVFFILFETTLRIFYPQNLNFIEQDPSLIHKHIPNIIATQSREEFSTTVSINSKGLRDYEYAYEKRYGIKRILVLGDSFAFGVGVEINDTIPKILERRLNDKNGVYKVINAGVMGYGTDQNLIYLEEEGLKYNPDIILLNFYTNDVYNVIDNDLFELKDEYLIQKPYVVQTKFNKLREYLSSHMHSYVLLVESYLRAKQSKLLKPSKEQAMKSRGLFPANSNATEYGWELTKKLLERIIHIGKSDNITVVIAINPGIDEVDSEAYREFLDYYNIEDKEINLMKAVEELLYLNEIEGVYLFNLQPYLAEENLKQKLYYPKDRHLNKYGYNFYSNTLFKLLSDTGIV